MKFNIKKTKFQQFTMVKCESNMIWMWVKLQNWKTRDSCLHTHTHTPLIGWNTEMESNESTKRSQEKKRIEKKGCKIGLIVVLFNVVHFAWKRTHQYQNRKQYKFIQGLINNNEKEWRVENEKEKKKNKNNRSKTKLKWRK